MGCGASKNDTPSSRPNSSNNNNTIDPPNTQPNTVPHKEVGETESLGKKEASDNDVVEENLDGHLSSTGSPVQSPSTQLPQKPRQKKEVDPLKGLGDSDDDDDDNEEQQQQAAPLSPFKKPANAKPANVSSPNSNSASSLSFNGSTKNRKKAGADDVVLEDAFDDLEDDTFASGSLRRKGSQGSFLMKKHGSGIFGPRGNQSMRKANTAINAVVAAGGKILVASGPSSPNGAMIGVASPVSMKPGKFAMNKPPAGSTMQHAVKVAGAQGANFGGFAVAPRKK